MNVGAVLDPLGAHALEVAWLVAALAPASEYGDRTFAALRPFRPGQEALAQARADRVRALADDVDAARLDALRETIRSAPDVVTALARSSMGEVLDDVAFLGLQRFVDAIAQIDVLLAQGSVVAPLGCAALHEIATLLEPGRLGRSAFYLADAFADDLARARRAAADAEAAFEAARGRAVATIARALGRDDLPPDEFILMRDALPRQLPLGVRVVREAPTYLLCSIAYDDATQSALERRERAAAAVDAAEERVRSVLSRAVGERSAALAHVGELLGELDVLVAAARFAVAHRCTVAALDDAPVLEFTGGRFLPLEARLTRERRSYAPIDLALDDVAVLTGPNMGGKSVALRTCGFIATCAAFGLPVPAARARVGLFDEIAWLGIGAEGDLGGLLSSFAKEVVRLRDTLARPTGRLLVLIDEFARTTTPHEGKALLVALLGALRERGAVGMVATHLGGVARAAGARHFAVRGLRGALQRVPGAHLAGALDALAAAMDYTIAPVGDDAGASGDAIELAAILGLDERLIVAARAALRGAADAFE